MKSFKVTLRSGEALTFTGTRLCRDGQGVHIFDADDNIVATFDNADVSSAYEVPS